MRTWRSILPVADDPLGGKTTGRVGRFPARCSKPKAGLCVTCYSVRSATIGSTPAARHAGIAEATSAATPSSNAATAIMTGSHGCTPKS